MLDPDTFTSPDSYDCALFAAGSAIDAVDRVMNRELDNAFVAAHNAAIRISTCATVNGYDVRSLARDALKRIEKLANMTA